jgi:phospholipase C
VPALLVSPYAKRGYVDSTTLDFTSALKFIETNWKVEPLADRDRAANTFLDAFDFNGPPRPPVFLGTQRQPTTVVRPRSFAVYASYSIVASLVTLLILIALFDRRRRVGAIIHLLPRG